MKNQALFSSKDKSKKLKCRLLQFLFGALRVNNGVFWGKMTISSLTFMFLCLPHQILEAHILWCESVLYFRLIVCNISSNETNL